MALRQPSVHTRCVIGYIWPHLWSTNHIAQRMRAFSETSAPSLPVWTERQPQVIWLKSSTLHPSHRQGQYAHISSMRYYFQPLDLVVLPVQLTSVSECLQKHQLKITRLIRTPRHHNWGFFNRVPVHDVFFDEKNVSLNEVLVHLAFFEEKKILLPHASCPEICTYV